MDTVDPREAEVQKIMNQWWCEHSINSRNFYTEGSYSCENDPLLRNHSAIDVTEIAHAQKLRGFLIEVSTCLRENRQIILESEFFCRQFFLPRRYISYRWPSSDFIPDLIHPPVLKTGYFPNYCNSVAKKKKYLFERYLDQVRRCASLIPCLDNHLRHNMKIIAPCQTTLWEFHLAGRHIHGFFYCVTDGKRVYFCDMYNSFLFPADVDYDEWDVRLKIAFDRISVYNLYLGEVAIRNQELFMSYGKFGNFYEPYDKKVFNADDSPEDQKKKVEEANRRLFTNLRIVDWGVKSLGKAVSYTEYMMKTGQKVEIDEYLKGSGPLRPPPSTISGENEVGQKVEGIQKHGDDETQHSMRKKVPNTEYCSAEEEPSRIKEASSSDVQCWEPSGALNPPVEQAAPSEPDQKTSYSLYNIHIQPKEIREIALQLLKQTKVGLLMENDPRDRILLRAICSYMLMKYDYVMNQVKNLAKKKQKNLVVEKSELFLQNLFKCIRYYHNESGKYWSFELSTDAIFSGALESRKSDFNYYYHEIPESCIRKRKLSEPDVLVEKSWEVCAPKKKLDDSEAKEFMLASEFEVEYEVEIEIEQDQEDVEVITIDSDVEILEIENLSIQDCELDVLAEQVLDFDIEDLEVDLSKINEDSEITAMDIEQNQEIYQVVQNQDFGEAYTPDSEVDVFAAEGSESSKIDSDAQNLDFPEYSSQILEAMDVADAQDQHQDSSEFIDLFAPQNSEVSNEDLKISLLRSGDSQDQVFTEFSNASKINLDGQEEVTEVKRNLVASEEKEISSIQIESQVLEGVTLKSTIEKLAAMSSSDVTLTSSEIEVLLAEVEKQQEDAQDDVEAGASIETSNSIDAREPENLENSKTASDMDVFVPQAEKLQMEPKIDDVAENLDSEVVNFSSVSSEVIGTQNQDMNIEVDSSRSENLAQNFVEMSVEYSQNMEVQDQEENSSEVIYLAVPQNSEVSNEDLKMDLSRSDDSEDQIFTKQSSASKMDLDNQNEEVAEVKRMPVTSENREIEIECEPLSNHSQSGVQEGEVTFENVFEKLLAMEGSKVTLTSSEIEVLLAEIERQQKEQNRNSSEFVDLCAPQNSELSREDLEMALSRSDVAQNQDITEYFNAPKRNLDDQNEEVAEVKCIPVASDENGTSSIQPSEVHEEEVTFEITIEKLSAMEGSNITLSSSEIEVLLAEHERQQKLAQVERQADETSNIDAQNQNPIEFPAQELGNSQVASEMDVLVEHFGELEMKHRTEGIAQNLDSEVIGAQDEDIYIGNMEVDSSRKKNLAQNQVLEHSNQDSANIEVTSQIDVTGAQDQSLAKNINS